MNASKELIKAESTCFMLYTGSRQTKLFLNTDKSQSKLIGTKANIKDKVISIKVNLAALELVSSLKLFGLHSEAHLSWCTLYFV